jgi:DUF2075 family protein
MHLYSGGSVDFIGDATRNVIADRLAESFEEHYRYPPPSSGVRAWRNSLRAMATALDVGALHDNGVIVEYQLPLTSRRLDVMVTGHDAGDRESSTVVELKQWDGAAPCDIEDCVEVFVGGGLRPQLHPSKQVGQYHRYLLDMHEAFSTGAVTLSSCAYLHNGRAAEIEWLRSAPFADLVSRHPLFPGDEVDSMVDLLQSTVGSGGGLPVLERVLESRQRPHKRLLEHTARVIANEPAFVLLDEQQVIFNHILARIRARQLSSSPTVFLVRGGPGTGKSVLAVNLLAELSRQGYATMHATGSRAFTENLRRIVGTRARAQFSYFNSFMEAAPDGLDVIVCDEAHRIREHSHNRFTPKGKRTEELQVDELVNSAKTTIFFIDDLQVVRPGELGSSALIREAAARRGADLIEHELEAQFRCGGSERYVSWVSNTLGLVRSADILWDPHDEFDFDIVDSPEELEAMIRSRNDPATGVRARLSAGFCWRWSKPNSDGTLVEDVQIGAWSMPWNAKPEARRLAEGIPSSHYWATADGGIDQVGCVYTAQGFEYDYAGVIFGRDLVYREGSGWVGQPEHSHDTVVTRSARQDPARFVDLVKSTYRVLLTRGLKGCYVHYQDAETRQFFRSRVGA